MENRQFDISHRLSAEVRIDRNGFLVYPRRNIKKVRKVEILLQIPNTIGKIPRLEVLKIDRKEAKEMIFQAYLNNLHSIQQSKMAEGKVTIKFKEQGAKLGNFKGLSMDTCHQNQQGLNDSFINIYISDAELLNLKMLVSKMIKIIRLKFDMSQFRRWQEENTKQEDKNKKLSITSVEDSKRHSIARRQVIGDKLRDARACCEDSVFLSYEILDIYTLSKLIQFLTPYEVNELSLINKLSFQNCVHLRQELNFTHSDFVPPDVLETLLRRFSRIKKLTSGKLFKLNPDLGNFVDIKLHRLQVLDLSKLSNSADKAVPLFLHVSPALSDISLPFYSITDSLLMKVKDKGLRLRSFNITDNKPGCSHPYINKKISGVSLYGVMRDIKTLEEFRVFAIDATYLKALRNTFEIELGQYDIIPSFEYIKSISLQNIKILNEDDLEYLRYFGRFPRLSDLHLGSIYKLNQSLTAVDIAEPLIPERMTDILMEIISQSPSLSSITLGQFCNDELLEKISKTLPNLKSLCVESPHISDSSLIDVFYNCKELQKLDIKACNKVNGNCFESLRKNGKLGEIAVNFDEYRMRCLAEILKERELNCLITNYFVRQFYSLIAASQISASLEIFNKMSKSSRVRTSRSGSRSRQRQLASDLDDELIKDLDALLVEYTQKETKITKPPKRTKIEEEDANDENEDDNDYEQEDEQREEEEEEEEEEEVVNKASKSKKGKKDKVDKPEKKENIDKNKKKEKKVKKSSKEKNDEMRSKILDYMRATNRPYSVINVYDNLHKEFSKKEVTETLDKLSEEGELVSKAYGKNIVYLYNQDKIPDLSKEELDELNKKVTEKQSIVEEKAQLLKDLKSTLFGLKSKMTFSELQELQSGQLREISLVGDEIKAYKEKKIDLISDSDIKKLEDKKDKLTNELKKRKRIQKELIETVSEMMDVKPNEIFEKFGLDA